jgi:FkbM family methyltransferase
VQVSRYAAKRLVLAPRTAYRRRRNRDLEPVARQLLETQAYGRAMYDFMAAVGANPDLLTDVPITEHGVALDLGAYIGDWSNRMADRYGCTVYAFEPSPGPAAKAADRLRAYPKVTVFPYGVAAADCTAVLTRDGPGSSIYGRTGTPACVDVRIRDIVAVLEELDLRHIDVLKINIEGAEYDVLERLAAANWLPRIGTLSVQFHEWHQGAHRRRKRIRDALLRSHDQAWSYGWVWEVWHARPEPATEATTKLAGI